jgi:hypothetical protein
MTITTFHKVILASVGGRQKNGVHLLEFLTKVFLPAGWPEGVSPGM